MCLWCVTWCPVFGVNWRWHSERWLFCVGYDHAGPLALRGVPLHVCPVYTHAAFAHHVFVHGRAMCTLFCYVAPMPWATTVRQAGPKEAQDCRRRASSAAVVGRSGVPHHGAAPQQQRVAGGLGGRSR
jgi:hypothetical protein